ncbi:MAG: YraN family protein [Verrucomicrobiota bacterium]
MGLVRFIAEAFSRFAKRSSNSSSSADADPRNALGRRGEDAAAKYLRRNGCKVLYRNFKALHEGEVDIVCRDGDTLVFVEVKTRTSDAFGEPVEAVTKSKQRLITRGALAWLRLLDNPEILIRFDVAEVRITGRKLEVSLIKNAFPLPEPYRY